MYGMGLRFWPMLSMTLKLFLPDTLKKFFRKPAALQAFCTCSSGCPPSRTMLLIRCTAGSVAEKQRVVIFPNQTSKLQAEEENS